MQHSTIVPDSLLSAVRSDFECSNSIPAATKFRKANSAKTPEEWRKIWLNKLESAMAREQIGEPRREVMRETIEDYLVDNPSSPYYIRDYRLKSYLRSSSLGASDALGFSTKKSRTPLSTFRLLRNRTKPLVNRNGGGDGQRKKMRVV